MNFAAVIFDLDGTLLETLTDIAASMNAVLVERGLPTHGLEAYRYFVGDGMTALARRALPEELRAPETVAACVQAMRTLYAQQWMMNSRPYAGIVQMLAELSRRGFILGVLSNKPDEFARLMVERLLPDANFAAVIGATQSEFIKPNPIKALELAGIFGLEPARVVFVGDSAVDMQTALNAGMYPVGVSWGFRPPAELLAAGAKALIDTPAELLSLLA